MPRTTLALTAAFALAFVLPVARSAAQPDGDDVAPAAPAAGVISVTDKAALMANLDKQVVVEGIVERAEWSGSGKVMNVNFRGTEQSRFAAVVFDRNRARFDRSFNRDAAAAFTGKRLRIRGELRTYGGRDQKLASRPEITISDPSQVTIFDPADAATTRPAGG